MKGRLVRVTKAVFHFNKLEHAIFKIAFIFSMITIKLDRCAAIDVTIL